MQLTPIRTPALWISGLCGSATLLLWAAPLLWGSQSWLNKDFKDWTDKDASALVSDSPWAKVMPLPSTDRPAQMVLEGPPNAGPQSTAALGNNTSNTSLTSTGQGSETTNTARTTVLTPSTRSQSTGAPAIQPTVTIIWASALPVRMAELKLRTHGQATDAEMQKLQKPRDHYVVVVLGLPAPDDLAQVSALAATASLVSQGKSIPCITSDFRNMNERNIYIFRFPKTPALGLDDREVEFRVTLGRMLLKKRFDLRDMQYQGKLAL